MKKLLSMLESNKQFQGLMPSREFLLSEAVRVTKLGIWTFSIDTNEIYWSEETYQCYGQNPETFVPNHESFINLIHPEDRGVMQNWIEGTVRNGRTSDLEFRAILPDDSVRTLVGTGEVLRDETGKPIRMLGTVQDITASKVSEKRINHLNRVYSLLSQINNLIVHAKQPEELFERACGIAVENGNYKLVRICLADEQTGELKPVTQCGADKETSEHAHCRTVDTLTEENPFGKKLFNGEFVCINNIKEETRIHSCEDCAMKMQCKSVAIFPLRVFGRTIGLISFFSDEIGFFDSEELRLLNEVSEDISFAIESHQRQEKQLIAEAILRESENRYRLILENSMDAILLTSSDGQVFSANPAACTMFGRTEEDICRVGRRGLVDIADPRLTTLLEDRERNGFVKGEVTLFRNDGTTLQAELSSSVFTDSKGETKTSMIIRDVTERIKTEKSLRESEARYRMLFDSNPLPLWVYDLQTLNYLAVNEAAVNHYGYTREEFLSMTLKDIRPPEDVPELLEEITRIQAGTEGLAIWRHKKKDGTIIQVEVAADDFEYAGRKARIVLSNDVSERKRTENELLSTTKELERYFTSSLDLLCIATLDGNFVRLNPEWEKTLGYPLHELVGKQFLSFVHPDDIESTLNAIKDLSQSNEVINFTNRYRHTDGTYRWIEWRSHPDMEKNLIYATARDITKRKLAEEALLKLKQAVNASGEIIFMTDKDGIIMFINPAFTEIYGYEAEEVIGKLTPRILKSGKFGMDAYEKLWNTISNGEYYWGEFLNKTKNGKEIIVDISINPIFDEQNVVTGYLSIQRDQTKQKQTEEERRKISERYQNLVQNARDVVFTLSADGVITSLNTWFEKITGWEVKDWADKKFTDIVHPEDLHLAQKQFIRSMQGEELQPHELRIKTKSGSYLIGEFTTTTEIKDGNVIGVLGIARDITEKKRLEVDFRQIQKMESIGTLAGGIAHDFNNILAIMIGHASLLQQTKVDAERLKKSVDAILKAGDRGAGLVKQLLTFARKTDSTMEMLALNSLVKEIIKLLHEILPKSITISPILEENLPLITGDITQLHQLVMNLSVNARDAMMPSGGTLTITTSRVTGDSLRGTLPEASANEYVELSVADTGSGIDEATRQRIFEPFFTTKEKGKGTGLGLSTVYGVVQSHGGLITLESEVGKGTTFHIYIPVQQVAKSSKEVQTSSQSDPQGGTETILLVEDEHGLRDLTKLVFEQMGYTVLAAEDGEKALELFAEYKNKIGVVVSDIDMPKLNGYQMFLRLKEMQSDVRVILASGYMEPQNKTEMIEAGVKGLIHKPYDTKEMLHKVREVLGVKM